MKQLTIQEVVTSQAVEQVEVNAEAVWREVAYSTVLELARKRGMFTTDDVWTQLNSTIFRTHEPRAMGPVMLRAVREGEIFATGIYHKSARTACHRRPIPIYVGRPR